MLAYRNDCVKISDKPLTIKDIKGKFIETLYKYQPKIIYEYPYGVKLYLTLWHREDGSGLAGVCNHRENNRYCFTKDGKSYLKITGDKINV